MEFSLKESIFNFLVLMLVISPLLLLIALFKPRLLLARTRLKVFLHYVFLVFVLFIATGIFSTPVDIKAEITKNIKNEKYYDALVMFGNLSPENKKDHVFVNQTKLALSKVVPHEVSSLIEGNQFDKARSYILESKGLLGETELSKLNKRIEKLEKDLAAKTKKKADIEIAKNRELSHKEDIDNKSESESESETETETTYDVFDEDVVDNNNQLTSISDDNTYPQWKVLALVKISNGSGKSLSNLNDTHEWVLIKSDLQPQYTKEHYCIVTEKLKLLEDKRVYSNGSKIGYEKNVIAKDIKSKMILPVCAFSEGKWVDDLTKEPIKNSGEVYFDYVVPLKELFNSGMDKWSASNVVDFSQSQDLILMSSSVWDDRYDGDLDSWIPEDEYDACDYIKKYANFKMINKLSFSDDDMDVMDDFQREDVENKNGTATECFISSVYGKGIISGNFIGKGDIYSDVKVRD